MYNYNAISQRKTCERTGPFHGGSLDVGERAWHQYLRTGLKIDAPQARFFLELSNVLTDFYHFYMVPDVFLTLRNRFFTFKNPEIGKGLNFF